MPLFIFLSGAVYSLAKQSRLDELAYKKFKRLLIPYFLCGLFFMLPIKRIFGFYNSSDFSSIIKSFILGTGEQGHLWFLPTLFWNFIIFYLINTIIKDKSSFALLLISLIFQKYYNVYIKIDIFCLSTSINYIFYFTCGYCFELWRKKIEAFLDKKIIYVFLFSIILSILLNIKYNFLNGYDNLFYNFIIIYFISYKLSKTKFANSNIINAIEKYSMSIYLFHDPLQYIILYIFFKKNLLNNEVMIFFYSICRIVGTILLSILIKKIIDYVITKAKDKNFI